MMTMMMTILNVKSEMNCSDSYLQQPT